MIGEEHYFEAQKYDFSDTSFNLLLQNRIYKVLLICSNYDAFLLEEDGRIDEQIFNEYVSLNLRYPPMFHQVDSSDKAFKILENENIDLVITAMGSQKHDVFQVAKNIKKEYPDIPIVILTSFSREVSLRLEKEDLSAIDYVFSWLGNADLLVAIIKLIEDRMNVESDVENVGVQTILFVEDSIRYISSYLPELYKIVLVQSRAFQQEALNEHQQMLRMRGRSKILLARDYEEATTMFKKYGNNMLGIISDVSFRREGQRDREAGLRFCRQVREVDPYMPFLLQSSDASLEGAARDLEVGFIHKYSKTLSIELRNYIKTHLAFGPFIFLDPETMKEVDRADNLQDFMHKMMTIPDASLDYHTSRHHFSKWLNARALFPLAQMFKALNREDFKTLEEMRRFIYNTISNFRFGKGRGIIAKFDKDQFDEYVVFSRIGNGSIGGKARGLAFLNMLIKKHKLLFNYPNVFLTIPRTIVISTVVFDEFMESNDLYKVGLSELSDEEILKKFVQAELPGWVYQDLYALAAVLTRPLAIRSSSKLEDSYYQPFAGIYSTYMIPLKHDKKEMVSNMAEAIKEVYASVYFQTSKSYMTATSHVIDEEKMGIILQEVVGEAQDGLYLPAISGVARSLNFYPIGNEKASEGIARIAFGLGKLVVEGGLTLRFSPRYPRKILQLSQPDLALKSTQKEFYALDLRKKVKASIDDGYNLVKLPIERAESFPVFKYMVSTYDIDSQMIRDGFTGPGKKLVSFTSILTHKMFPLAEILQELLQIGQKEMNNPVEIEFAINMTHPGKGPVIFNVLQIRPIVESDQHQRVQIDRVEENETIIMSKSAMGNGIIQQVRDVVYVKPDAFNPGKTKDMAQRIEKLNRKFIEQQQYYILVGPGRWGSQDPWLGIPVKWPNISRARLIVESGLKDFQIDPSQGTHFFQNLTAFRVGYFTINPFMKDGYYDLEYLNQKAAEYEDEYLRHVRFEKDLLIKIDGLNNRGVVLKPNC
jgi:CheY-like chemotaxis protein